MQLHLQLDTSSKRRLLARHRLSPTVHKRPSRTAKILQRQERRRPHWPSGRNTPTATRVYVAIRSKQGCLAASLTSLPIASAKPDRLDAGRYWACMTLRSASECWADTWRRWWAMDYRDGSLRYTWVPKRRHTPTNFFFRAHTWVYGTAYVCLGCGAWADV